jgi:WD40 repeat protein
MQRLLALLAFLAGLGLFAKPHLAAQAPQSKQPRVDALGDPLPEAAVARIGTTRFRHGGMDLLGFTPDSKAVIFLGVRGLHWMDVVSGKEIKTVALNDADRIPYDLAIKPVVLCADTQVLAYIAGRYSGEIIIADTATGKERKRFSIYDFFKANLVDVSPRLALTGNGRFLLVSAARSGHPFVVIDTTTGQTVRLVAPEKGSQIGNVRFSHDDKHVVFLEARNGDKDQLRILDFISGKLVRVVLLPANARFERFELRPDGKTFVGVVGDRIAVYDFSAGDMVKKVRDLSDVPRPEHFCLSPNGKQMFVTTDGKLYQWDVDAGKEQRQIDAADLIPNISLMGLAARGVPSPMVVSPNGKLLLVTDKTFFAAFDATSGQRVSGAGLRSGIRVVQFTPDGKALVVGDGKCALQLWGVPSAKLLRSLDPVEGKTLPSPITAGRGLRLFFGNAAFSSDGKLVAADLGGYGAGLWDAGTGKVVKHFDLNPDEISYGYLPTSLAFAPRSDLLAIASPEGKILLWNAATSQKVLSWRWFAAPREPIDAAMFSLAFSPDGKTLAGAGVIEMSEGALRIVTILWETSTGQERLRLESKVSWQRHSESLAYGRHYANYPLSLAFSPDGKRLAIGTYAGLHLVDALTGKDIVSYCSSLILGRTTTFSHDGKFLFVVQLDGSLRVLDAATGRVVRDFAGHSEMIRSLSLSSDGKLLASGSNDSTGLLWDVAELTRLLPASEAGLTVKELEALWRDLGDDDAGKAYLAIHRLSAAAEAGPFLQERLKPVPPLDPTEIEKLLRDLDAKSFAERDKAMAELERYGDLAGPALQQRLKAKPSLEMRQRIDQLLAKLGGPVRSPEVVRMLRAIEVLAHLATPEAIATLAALAKGAPGHRATEDARAALERFKLRTP